jgi:selenocysteine-specific elongation factor
LQERGVIAADDSAAKLPEHTPRLSPDQQRAAGAYMKLLASNPYSPPTDSPLDAELLQVLVDQGLVVRATDDVVFLKSTFDDMMRRALDHARSHGSITIQDMRDMFGTSRKYTLAFLEHLDRQQITRRQGDVRVLR